MMEHDLLQELAQCVHTPPFGSVSLSLEQAKFLSEVPVTLGVEIGNLLLSAEQLIDLLPGQVFEFQFDPHLPVRLLLGEEHVGSARFVMHGEQLALEVVSAGGANRAGTFRQGQSGTEA